MLAVVNGNLMGAASATIPALDLGLLRGDGVFDVVRLYQGVPFALEEHLGRLKRSADAIGLSIDTHEIEDDITALLEAIPREDGNLRMVVTRSGSRLVLQEPTVSHPVSYRLMLIPHLVTPLLSGVKSLSYALNCHARRLAQVDGYDDALLFSLATGEILEGPFNTFAWAEDGRLYTPPLSAGILDSITRRVLIQSTEVQERACSRDALARAEGACVVGTGIEVAPVSEVGGVCTFSDTADVIREATTAVSEAVQERLRLRSRVTNPGRTPLPDSAYGNS
jgi:branched-chain amino acid aminotransferase